MCFLILARSVRSSSFDVRLPGSSTIPIASFVERGLFIKTFCHRKYLNRRIVYSSGHRGTFNPAVITNKEVHMVYGNINTNYETSHTTSNAKKRSLKISDYFSKQNENLLYLVSKLCKCVNVYFIGHSPLGLFRTNTNK